MTHLAHQLLLRGNVQTAVQRGALKLVQQEILAPQEAGGLALAGVPGQAGGRGRWCPAQARQQAGAGRGEGPGGQDRLVDRNLGLGRLGDAEGGHDAHGGRPVEPGRRAGAADVEGLHPVGRAGHDRLCGVACRG